jgi:hypothetical protein
MRGIEGGGGRHPTRPQRTDAAPRIPVGGTVDLPVGGPRPADRGGGAEARPAVEQGVYC